MNAIRSRQRAVGALYKRVLWGMMELLGIDESIRRKVMVAVGIQFGAGVALVGTMLFLEGAVATIVGVGVFALAAIAFFNTALIVREDLLGPLEKLESSAEEIAAGSLTAEPPRIDQDDEIGSLAGSFEQMQETLQITAEQADALAGEEFDDPVLEATVPGAFGDSMDRMAKNLSSAISDLEARSTRLTRLIEEFETASARASEGDLGVRLPADAIDDRFEDVVDSYNRQLEAFESTVGRAKPFADDVAEASATARVELSAVSETSAENAEQVTEIAADAGRQSEMLESLAGDAETLSATVEEIAATSNELSEIASETASHSDEGVAAAEDAREALHVAAEIAGETEAAVKRLVERTESIREIVEFIDEVASRTDLLAVNASIEAARAETDTAGFEVVASEVKSLAEETHESAGEIEAIIGAIDEETHAVADDVDRLTDHIERAVETVDDATEEFTGIANDTARVEESAAEISQATDQQASVASEVSAAVDELVDIAESTAGRADEVKTNASEGSERLTEATDSVAALADQADRLADALETFEVGEEATPESATPQPAD